MMKVMYIGDNIGIDGLTNNQIYTCINIEGDYLRILDDSGGDYLYPINNPASLHNKNGKWQIITDDAVGTLNSLIYSTV